MCLQSDNVVIIAQEDIVCYKIYFRFTFQETWKSPFLKCKLPEFGETIKVNSLKDGIYTFSTIEGAIRLTTLFSSWIRGMISMSSRIEINIVECVIPKGSEYMQGIDTGTNSPAYCSKELKFIESVAILNKENYWQEIEKLYDSQYNSKHKTMC